MADLFVHAAEGMFSLIGDCSRASFPRSEEEIHLAAPDPETLLVDWLNELLYLSEAEDVLYCSFDVRSLTPISLVARVAGNPPICREQEIKSATFHDLHITETAEGFEVTIVFDV
jgi:SHS2 domain-containing protein